MKNLIQILLLVVLSFFLYLWLQPPTDAEVQAERAIKEQQIEAQKQVDLAKYEAEKARIEAEAEAEASKSPEQRAQEAQLLEQQRQIEEQERILRANQKAYQDALDAETTSVGEMIMWDIGKSLIGL